MIVTDTNPGYVSYSSDDQRVQLLHDGSYTAWVNGRSWFLTPEEQQLSASKLIEKIESDNKGGKVWRCSDCGSQLAEEEIAGFPLFCGVNCAACWEKHLAKCAEEVRLGHVCRFCRKAYSQCCC